VTAGVIEVAFRVISVVNCMGTRPRVLITTCISHIGVHLGQSRIGIGVHLIYGHASHTWACTPYIGVHLIHGRAPHT
jgi:hypothetical protein